MNAPRVSVVLPVRNARQTIDEALDSVLMQTYREFELIVVDDGSSDGTADRLRDAQVRDARVRIARGSSTGATDALNYGLSLASGMYVARHDADDRSQPTRFERQVDELDRRSSLCALGTRAVTIDERGGTIAPFPVVVGAAAVRRALHRGLIPPCHGSMMIRRESLARVGGYRTAFAAAQDLDLWLRLLEIGDIDNLDECLYHWRLSADSVYRQKRRRQLLYAGIALAFATERKRYGRDSYPSLLAAAGDLEAFASRYRLRGLLQAIWGDLLLRGLDDPTLANHHLRLAVRNGYSRPGVLLLLAWTSLGLHWAGSKPVQPLDHPSRQDALKP